jgi:hypothetical protein
MYNTMKWTKEEEEGKEEEVEFRYRTLSEVKEGAEKQPKAEAAGEEWKDKGEEYKFSYETLTEEKEGEKSPAVKSEER